MRQILLVLALITVLTILSGCDTGALTVGKSYNQQAEPFSNRNLGTLAADPDRYIGSRVDLTGRVTARPGGADGGAWRLQVEADTNKSETKLYVVVEADRLDIKTDDYIRFKGTLEDDPEKSRFEGAGEDLPFVRADDFRQIASHKVLAPTRRLVEPGVSESQFDVKVTVEKIEFAEEETRVYIQIDNGTEWTVRLNNNRMKLLQGAGESDLLLDPAHDYERLPADLPTGRSAAGILAFPPASYEEGSLQLTIGASTDDYTQLFEPFELAVEWTPSAD